MDPNQPTPKLPGRLARAVEENTGLRLSRAEVRNVARLERIADVTQDLISYLTEGQPLTDEEGRTLTRELLQLLEQRKRTMDA